MKRYPQTTVLDLLRLLGNVASTALRRGDQRAKIAAWLRDLTQRYQSPNLTVNLLVRKILFVSGSELSNHVLHDPPNSREYVAGTLKQKAMSFLAPHALTISADAQWQALRPYNERVLCTGAQHIHQQAFLDQVHRAFAAPITDLADIHRGMGMLMLNIVFGENNAPSHFVDDIQVLFGEVNVRTALLGSRQTKRRAQFYDDLRAIWQQRRAADTPTLLGMAHAHQPMVDADRGDEEVLLQQIPHWMFTFTGSGSDLLGRTLAMITSRPEILARVQAEITAAGSLAEAATIDRLDYLTACLLETGRLYPPVTQTAHRAPQGDAFQGVTIPSGTELLHYFPLTNRDTTVDLRANHFRPQRWLDPADSVHQHASNLFLSGARACPGRDLILFVCKAALAILIQNHGVRASSRQLASDPVPFSFPQEAMHFTS